MIEPIRFTEAEKGQKTEKFQCVKSTTKYKLIRSVKMNSLGQIRCAFYYLDVECCCSMWFINKVQI